MDLIHNILKNLDHNRYTYLGLAAASTMITVSACSPTRVVNPLTGEIVSGDQAVDAFNQEFTNLEQEFIANTAAIKQLVTRNETITQESELLSQRFEGTWKQIEAQEERNNALLTQVLDFASPALASVGLSPDLVMGALGVVGLGIGGGTILDRRRKDTVIRKLKSDD